MPAPVDRRIQFVARRHDFRDGWSHRHDDMTSGMVGPRDGWSHRDAWSRHDFRDGWSGLVPSGMVGPTAGQDDRSSRVEREAAAAGAVIR